MKKQTGNMTYEEALSRCASLCSQCEQCSVTLSDKMTKWGVSQNDVRRVIRELERLEFLDDYRYARAYAHDKLRFSGWGINKIKTGLWQKRLSRDVIEQSMDNIEEEEYTSVACRILMSKIRSMKEWPPRYETKMKLFRHMAQRGFELSVFSRIYAKALKDYEEECEGMD